MKEPKGWHSRGYLPHLDSPQLVQTVTFRLADSLPRAVALELRDRDEDVARWDAVLDAGYGACWLRDPTIADLVEEALLHFDGIRYRLIAWCVMPNHVHVMAEIVEGFGSATSWRRGSNSRRGWRIGISAERVHSGGRTTLIATSATMRIW